MFSQRTSALVALGLGIAGLTGCGAAASSQPGALAPLTSPADSSASTASDAPVPAPASATPDAPSAPASQPPAGPTSPSPRRSPTATPVEAASPAVTASADAACQRGVVVLVTISALDDLCLVQGATVRLRLGGRNWSPVRVSGDAVTKISDGPDGSVRQVRQVSLVASRPGSSLLAAEDRPPRPPPGQPGQSWPVTGLNLNVRVVPDIQG